MPHSNLTLPPVRAQDAIMIKRVLMFGALAFAVLPSACGSSAPANATDFCHQVESVGCTKAFQCVPLAAQDQEFKDSFGDSLAACNAMVQTDCATFSTDCTPYSSSQAEICVNKVSAVTCADVATLTDLPTECNAACGQ
jgi:hypothetical protein